jgi:hypothetical protein
MQDHYFEKGGLSNHYLVLSEHLYFLSTAISPLWGDLLINRVFFIKSRMMKIEFSGRVHLPGRVPA